MSQGRRKGALAGLTQREQEVMDVVYQNQPCTANLICDNLSSDLKNATVRTVLRSLESKKVVEHEQKGKQFFYSAIENKKSAATKAFKSVVNTFFDGSFSDAVVTFLDDASMDMSQKELDELKRYIQCSRKTKDSSTS